MRSDNENTNDDLEERQEERKFISKGYPAAEKIRPRRKSL
jgi:hypothetical protein